MPVINQKLFWPPVASRGQNSQVLLSDLYPWAKSFPMVPLPCLYMAWAPYFATMSAEFDWVELEGLQAKITSIDHTQFSNPELRIRKKLQEKSEGAVRTPLERASKRAPTRCS